jgi:phosphoglycerate-specific signal transduction histidine kinase
VLWLSDLTGNQASANTVCSVSNRGQRLWQARFAPFGLCMPVRRLEDRIRELCARVTSAKEPERRVILEELHSAVHEHLLRGDKPIVRQRDGKPQLIRERRQDRTDLPPKAG